MGISSNDSYPVDEDQSLTVAAPGILDNDTDVEGNTLTAVKVSDPAHGALTLNSDGSFSYIPNADFNGADSFSYQANDGTINSNIATVNITVTPVNDAPVITGQADLSTPEDTALTITLNNLTVTDPDNTYPTDFSLTVQSGTNYTLVGNTLTPAADFNGTLTVPVIVNDGAADSDIYNLTVTVGTANDAPVITESDPQAVSMSEDSLPTAFDLTLHAMDAEADTLTWSIFSAASNGTATASGTGTSKVIGYTPTPNYTGSDSFVVQVSDGNGGTDTITVNVTITRVNDAPVAQDQSVTTAEDTPVDITLDAMDVDGDTLTYTVITPPSHGALSGTAPHLTYTPAANYNGPDIFIYTANDGAMTSNVATVSIMVAPVNDAPVAVDDAYTADYETLLSISAPGVLGNDTDVDSASLSAVVVTNPAHGLLVLNADGSFTYTPSAGYSGADSFTYQASDGQASSNVATVALTVRPPDVIFKDGFESGNLTTWSGALTDGGHLSVSPSAALVGSQGLQGVISDNNSLYVTDATPNAESRYRVRFYFDPNSISMADGDAPTIFNAYDALGNVVARILLCYNRGYQLYAGLRSDGGAWTNTSYYNFSDAPHYFELDWQAATGAEANDGSLTLWIDGVQKSNLIGIDNDTRRVDYVRLGAVSGIGATTRGTFYFDAFESRRQTLIGPEPL